MTSILPGNLLFNSVSQCLCGISIPFLLFAGASAEAFQIGITPSKINPGDAFVIKVSQADISEPFAASLDRKPIHFGSCGEDCLIAIGVVDIKTRPGLRKIPLEIGNIKTTVRLPVKKVKFPSIRLTLPEEKVSLSREDEVRAEREVQILKSLWGKVSERFWEGGFELPLDNGTSTGFGVKRIINGKKISTHLGLDIRGIEGEEVRASNRGKVVLAEELFFGGKTVILDHGQGIFTVYMHLSAYNVDSEDIVSKGDVIGFVGSSGRASGPHLHFGVKIEGVSANPLSLMKLDLPSR